MVDVVFSGIRQVVDQHGIIFYFIYADILVNEQRTESVLSQQGVMLHNSHLRKQCQLLYLAQYFI